MTTKTEPILFDLYGGKVIVKLSPDSHIYTVNGKRVTGVTTYIGIKDKSRPLTIWATELMRDFLLTLTKITPEDIYHATTLYIQKKAEAADTGTKIHKWIEEYIKSTLDGDSNIPEMPEEQAVLIGVTAFLHWATEHKVEFLSSERIVYSKKYGYVGTMDIEAKVDGKLALVDIKSSNALYNSVNMQTAAYAKADEEESKRKYKTRWAIRLAKESENDYNRRMQKKAATAIASGRTPRQPDPYVPFEAKELLTDIDFDFEAFLACQTLYKWDKETDYYLNKVV